MLYFGERERFSQFWPKLNYLVLCKSFQKIPRASWEKRGPREAEAVGLEREPRRVAQAATDGPEQPRLLVLRQDLCAPQAAFFLSEGGA